MDDIKKGMQPKADEGRKQRVAEELRSKARFEDENVDFALNDRANAGTPTFGELMATRIERRSFLKGATAVAALPIVGAALNTTSAEAQGTTDTLSFAPITGSSEDEVVLPTGYGWNSILAWGDSLDGTTPALTSDQIRAGYHLGATGAANQANQFGYNCDAVEFFPLPVASSSGANSGLVCVNHEYPTSGLLFAFGEEADASNTLDVRNYADGKEYFAANNDAAQFLMNMVGITVAEIEKSGNEWSLVGGSAFNRRITLETVFRLSGPAAGSDLVQTNLSPEGIYVKGTYNNCAAGGTPYGTYLTTEENFDQLFGNFSALEAAIGDSTDEDDIRTLEFHRRISPSGGTSSLGLEAVDGRFDTAKEPREAFRFGWVSEINPYQPTSIPAKRTALGRFKHECATTITSSDGKLVVYMGDDARFEYVYKFVSAEDVSETGGLGANLGLLDEGTLYVAKFNDDGTGEWLALDYDSSTELQNATIDGTSVAMFRDQADVLVGARMAGDVLGATPMDRPEDVEANPVTNKVYVACTNNTRRTEEAGEAERQGRMVDNGTNVQNPRYTNSWGHVVEITEAGDVNSATTFEWEIFMLCGDPEASGGRFLTQLDDTKEKPLQPGDTYFAGYTGAEDLPPIGAPDNLSFDNEGNLWIVTDGTQPTGLNNGCFAVPTEGENRGYLRQFMSGPVDCEVCGAEFTPDNTTLFLNIQHPGDGGTISNGTSDFPNFGSGEEPRPTLMGVYRTDGGVVGS